MAALNVAKQKETNRDNIRYERARGEDEGSSWSTGWFGPKLQVIFSQTTRCELPADGTAARHS